MALKGLSQLSSLKITLPQKCQDIFKFEGFFLDIIKNVMKNKLIEKGNEKILPMMKKLNYKIEEG